jgi:hypothetical protein
MRWALATAMVLVTAACHRAPQPTAVAQPRAGTVERTAEPVKAPEPATVAEPVSHGETVMWQPEERQYLLDLLRELRRSGERDAYRILVEFVGGVEALVAQADRGELTKVQLLTDFQQVEERMTEPVGDRITQQMDDLREVMRRARRVPGR